ncbi:hypothetical protein PAXINDRAFT_172368 [Paxillus involutus ATCC 200175]|uniref:PX-domain-containing protein n=1 Tax=Paxillus involutus ATCC 200175 TaxID=664439 RepID=A0A0C9SQP5_PAXIN|nr:hypothetical protein PAXINDRAFT_172368 [Paxillus involutus ATCC 200175]
MATLPRTAKQTSASASIPTFDHRPRSDPDFDVGINASAAWTGHLDRGSLSDDEPADDDPALREEKGLRARALYQFEGKAEFRELTVEAGDVLDILKEDIGDGWSLVRTAGGEIGLLPTTYYTYTTSFLSAPSDSQPTTRTKELSTDTVTPKVSPKGISEPELPPLVPQNTGEWRNVLPSLRQGVLRGKTLNRFSSFVTSGAEEWILNGIPDLEDNPRTSTFISHSRFSTADSTAEENRPNTLGVGEADRHFVDAGPAWQSKIPRFRVLVHSPSKRSSGFSGAYTIYNVTSLFSSGSECTASDDEMAPSPTPTCITVQRRFSHFVVLHNALLRRLPGIALPPLPEKQYAGRFNAAFVEARRGDLERYVDRIVRHPIARYAEVVTSFLSCEDDLEWKRLMPQYLSMRAAGPSFFAHVFHPAFNVDVLEASETIERFDNHLRAVGKGVQGLRGTFSRVREARMDMSKAERLLSYSLLSLITAKPSSSAPALGIVEEEENTSPQLQGLVNDEGAWCWREGCEDCLKLTKAVQKTVETLQSVADLYDDHARRTQLATHESLKSVAHPYMTYQGIIETHRSTSTRYAETTSDDRDTSNEDMVTRCETVLNATMSEIDTYHTQKVEDFTTLAKGHLDGEIALYEQILTRLNTARQALDPPHFDELGRAPRRPSRFEKDLDRPVNDVEPLPQPCPHVYDSAPMRPVNVAIQGGVGMLLGSPSSVGRTSVLSRLWA